MTSSDSYDILNDFLFGNRQSTSSSLNSLPLVSPVRIPTAHEHFQRFKTNLELDTTFDELIQQKHNAVRTYLENKGVNIETKLIGSLQRKTRIKPRQQDTFDIDILAVFGEFDRWVNDGGMTAQQSMQNMHEILLDSSRYGAMSPTQDQPTITIEHSGNIKVEIVPAYRDMVGFSPDGSIQTIPGRGYWVPKSGTWAYADYDHEADYITRMNAAADDKVVPTIKMLKAIKREHFSAISSIHLETLAVQIVPISYRYRQSNNLPTGYGYLIADFLHYAKDMLTSPARIPDSRSSHHELDTLSAIYLPVIFENLKNWVNSILVIRNENEKIRAWRSFFGEPFPLTI